MVATLIYITQCGSILTRHYLIINTIPRTKNLTTIKNKLISDRNLLAIESTFSPGSMSGLWTIVVFKSYAVGKLGLWMKLGFTGLNNSTLIRNRKIGIGGMGHWEGV